MEITHIHDHPLMFKEEVEKNIYGASLFCNVCDEAVVGPYYSCNQCPRSSSFIVHKSCTELPVQMHHHPLHAEHPLTLIRNARNYTCNVCREKFYGPTLATFAYCCSKSGCDFILDLKCASTWHKVTENHFGDHPHQFSRYKKPKLKFECEACGEEGRYSVYICSICKLWVHKNCTSLPGHLKTGAHPHLLMLKWSLEGIMRTCMEAAVSIIVSLAITLPTIDAQLWWALMTLMMTR
ncbi:hypothetical protein L3X38_038348 [Prunus dulcis]|uniref:DC1 domain-containing protein n=1 Tax=Prunus dulcis TaxID=3755 RepID=A0AAD4YRG0_PRUDU|nr:hypothetical protein L3X38_038348 [Prunus dulcis]